MQETLAIIYFKNWDFFVYSPIAIAKFLHCITAGMRQWIHAEPMEKTYLDVSIVITSQITETERHLILRLTGKQLQHQLFILNATTKNGLHDVDFLGIFKGKHLFRSWTGDRAAVAIGHASQSLPKKIFNNPKQIIGWSVNNTCSP